jgi:hypothetical protein
VSVIQEASHEVFVPIDKFLLPHCVARCVSLNLLKKDRYIEKLKTNHLTTLWGIKILLRTPPTSLDDLLEPFSSLHTIHLVLSEANSDPFIIEVPHSTRSLSIFLGKGKVFLNSSHLTHLTVKAKNNSEVLFIQIPPLVSIFLSNIGIPLDNLPNTLTQLHIDGDYDFSLDYLPPKLQYLRITSATFDQHLDHLPHSLLGLSIGSDEICVPKKQMSTFNKPIDNLPIGLRSRG